MVRTTLGTLVLFCTVAACRSPDVRLVPIGRTPPSLTESLAAYYEETLDLNVVVGEPLLPPPAAYDLDRGQLVAEELIVMLRASEEERSTGDPVVIGVAVDDMFIAKYDWRYAYAFRSGGRFGVVSGARMDPGFYGEEPDEELFVRRVRKMVTKSIGVLLYDLPLNDDPRSVLRRSVMGPDDLDEIDEDTITRDVIEAAERHRSDGR